MIKIKDVIAYFQGNIRYSLYYSKFRFLLRKHIVEQYEFRIMVMKEECLLRGHCVKCGCKTTHLQFANKACEGKCYPAMMSKKKWKEYSTRYE